MSFVIRNFKAIGFTGSYVAAEIFVDSQGLICETADENAQIIDCAGAWLSPGWADLHVHVWHGGTDISVRPGDAGLCRGVTAMADAGSSGEAAFHGLREYIIEPSPETIKAFVNIGSIGLVACNRVSELTSINAIDIDRTLAVIEANRDVICGIKVRAGKIIVGDLGIAPALIAKRVAEIAGLPLMVHIGRPSPMVDEIFDLLTPGDIITHCFHGKSGGSVLDTPNIFSYAMKLADSGVHMDVGHGGDSFDFKTAETAIKKGLKPFSISTDIHLKNVNGPVFDMATTAAKLLAVGLTFEEVIDCITHNPRSFLNLESRQGLRVGQKADFTVFDLCDDDLKFTDSTGHTRILEKMLEPRMTILGPKMTPASRRSLQNP